MTTINEIYAAINPMPAMLSDKGKVRPEVQFGIDANAGAMLTFIWVKPDGVGFDRDYHFFRGDTADEVLAKAGEFINALPDAKTARLHAFMGQLGKVIDCGRDLGIEVDYLNPLTDTMKRLSENIITHQPEAA